MAILLQALTTSTNASKIEFFRCMNFRLNFFLFFLSKISSLEDYRKDLKSSHFFDATVHQLLLSHLPSQYCPTMHPLFRFLSIKVKWSF